MGPISIQCDKITIKKTTYNNYKTSHDVMQTALFHHIAPAARANTFCDVAAAGDCDIMCTKHYACISCVCSSCG